MSVLRLRAQTGLLLSDVGCARPWYQQYNFCALFLLEKGFLALIAYSTWYNAMRDMEYDEKFNEYVEMIVAHPNYQGLYFDRNDEGKVNWVVTGKSKKGKIRQAWWDQKCIEHGVPIQSGCYAKIARVIHPTGMHVCQCCGKEKSIYYEYPNKNTAKKLNDILGTNIDPNSDEQRVEYTIKEIIEKHCDTIVKARKIAEYLGITQPNSVNELISTIYRDFVACESTKFSPGVMSNSPDRFDGFHSYGLCCRTTKDTGRHPENMDTYAQDRRAYEEWSDGNYNLANRLMGEYRKQEAMICPMCGKTAKMSADHIGPISLGFCHSNHFAPMCLSCNSAKNNRFSKNDVDILIALENEGEQVISWHSKYIWDLLKNNINDDEDAQKASSIMAKCHQNIIAIFAIIYKKTGADFLMRYLHPEYSMKDYRFKHFDLRHLERMEVIEAPLDSKNKRKNQERYIRIAFDSLKDFLSKDNRKNYFLIDEDSKELNPIIYAICKNKYTIADKCLKDLLKNVSERIFQKEKSINHYKLDNSENFLAAEPKVNYKE